MRVALVALAALACVRPVEAPGRPQETGARARPCYCEHDLAAGRAAREAPQARDSRLVAVSLVASVARGLPLLALAGQVVYLLASSFRRTPQA